MSKSPDILSEAESVRAIEDEITARKVEELLLSHDPKIIRFAAELGSGLPPRQVGRW